ncbi:MAG: site-specific DNA-methyltransferase [Candidatus Sumerlaeota bacterium]|nr:site-specific DNA-methyltransferase [Candidatus Sumerlaeota bacterium]
MDSRLRRRFEHAFVVDPSLNRQLVSFQDSKARPAYRWFKYKEAFSASLVELLLSRHSKAHGRLLDPFAGSGTALFASSAMGMSADGIELLPIGQELIETRYCLERKFSPGDFAILDRWRQVRPWRRSKGKQSLPELRITAGAYPPETASSIEAFLAAAEAEAPLVRRALRFALLCVLESTSYTRKDGQYLRWDFRSARKQGSKPFDKGRILGFDEAVCAKILEILSDLEGGRELFDAPLRPRKRGEIRLFPGSSLDILPTFTASSYDIVLTSPPYCNRYDYTRTYALELALLGIDECGMSDLRQSMLSCTVENRAKDLLAINGKWSAAIEAAECQDLLQAILRYLEEEKRQGRLNNNGIPRMVRGYFQEMACVIQECARVLRRGGTVIVVNDNVRYAGASVSVDLILSDIAEHLGFQTEKILILPQGKGNSSQQMGEHGRESLRKCVYIWRKP